MANSKAPEHAFLLSANLLRTAPSMRSWFIKQAKQDGDKAAVAVFLTLLPMIKTDDDFLRMGSAFYAKHSDDARAVTLNVALNTDPARLRDWMEDATEKAARGEMSEGDYLESANALKVIHDLREESLACGAYRTEDE